MPATIGSSLFGAIGVGTTTGAGIGATGWGMTATSGAFGSATGMGSGAGGATTTGGGAVGWGGFCAIKVLTHQPAPPRKAKMVSQENTEPALPEGTVAGGVVTGLVGSKDFAFRSFMAGVIGWEIYCS